MKNSAQSFSRVELFVAPWTVASQAPLSMGFHRQEYWRGVPFSHPGDLLDPGLEPMSPVLTGKFFTTSATWETPCEEYVLPTDFLRGLDRTYVLKKINGTQMEG